MDDLNDSQVEQETAPTGEDTTTIVNESEIDNEAKRIDTYLSLLTVINNGIEDLLGTASRGVIFNTGVEEGRRLGSEIPKTNTLRKALDIVNEAYEGVWEVELYKRDEKYKMGLFDYNIDSKGSKFKLKTLFDDGAIWLELFSATDKKQVNIPITGNSGQFVKKVEDKFIKVKPHVQTTIDFGQIKKDLKEAIQV